MTIGVERPRFLRSCADSSYEFESIMLHSNRTQALWRGRRSKCLRSLSISRLKLKLIFVSSHGIAPCTMLEGSSPRHGADMVSAEQPVSRFAPAPSGARIAAIDPSCAR